MQRWTALALGLLLVGAIIVVLLRVRNPEPATNAPEAEPTPAASSEDSDGAVDSPAPDAGKGQDGGPVDDPFARLPDGGSVPQLPPSAPASVTFGVILFSYAGAQYAPPDAPDKTNARNRALEVLPAAKQDFTEAVKKGDPGSTADAGRIPRGILEPALEYILFTMDKGSVHDAPIDTPRGYWIVRRHN
jgi:hypothetical protein